MAKTSSDKMASPAPARKPAFFRAGRWAGSGGDDDGVKFVSTIAMRNGWTMIVSPTSGGGCRHSARKAGMAAAVETKRSAVVQAPASFRLPWPVERLCISEGILNHSLHAASLLIFNIRTFPLGSFRMNPGFRHRAENVSIAVTLLH